MSSKVNLLTPGCGEQKYSVCCWALSNGVGDKPQIQSNLAFVVVFYFHLFLLVEG